MRSLVYCITIASWSRDSIYHFKHQFPSDSADFWYRRCTILHHDFRFLLVSWSLWHEVRMIYLALCTVCLHICVYVCTLEMEHEKRSNKKFINVCNTAETTTLLFATNNSRHFHNDMLLYSECSYDLLSLMWR